MKKIILTLGLLALTGNFLSLTASSDRDPLDRPLITGAPHINPEAPRPGPFTPRPQNGTKGTTKSSVSTVYISNTLTGRLQVILEDLESGESYVMPVCAGDCLFVPDEGDWLVTLKQNGKTIDSEFVAQ